MARLFLRFLEPLDAADEPSTTNVEWLILGNDDAIAAQGSATADELGQVAARCEPWLHDPANVLALISTNEALALSCEVPGRNAVQLRRAAPYAVEEFVTQDIEAMQVACGTLARGEPVRCLVASRQSLAGYLACMESAGIRPGWLTTEAMALPTAPDLLTILYLGDSALVRTADHTASVDLANLPTVLDAACAGIDVEEGPRLRQINGTLSDIHLSQLEIAPERVQSEPADGSLLAYLAAEFDPGNAINLLQGDFAPKRAPGGAWAGWRSVAAGVGAWLALALALLAAEGMWASYQADALRDEASQLYRDLYDVERVTGNPASRMRFRLGQAPAAKAGFHHLLGSLGGSLQELPGRFRLESLTYSERRGLSAEVIVPDYDALETLQDSLAQRGVEMEVVSAEQEQDRVRSNLRVVEAG